MEVTELAFAPSDTTPSASQHQLAPAGARIYQIIHVIVASHECPLFAKVEVADAFNRGLDFFVLYLAFRFFTRRLNRHSFWLLTLSLPSLRRDNCFDHNRCRGWGRFRLTFLIVFFPLFVLHNDGLIRENHMFVLLYDLKRSCFCMCVG